MDQRAVGRHVDARLAARELQVFTDGRLVKTHVRAAGRGKVTDWGDYPPERIAFHMRTPTWCIRAAELGAATSAVVADLLEVNALFRLRGQPAQEPARHRVRRPARAAAPAGPGRPGRGLRPAAPRRRPHRSRDRSQDRAAPAGRPQPRPRRRDRRGRELDPLVTAAAPRLVAMTVSAPRSPGSCWSPSGTTRAGCAAKPPSRTCAGSHRSRPAAAGSTGTGSTAAATAPPTARSTRSCCAGSATTPPPRPTPCGAPNRACPNPRSSAASSATSCGRFTAPCYRPPHRKKDLAPAA